MGSPRELREGIAKWLHGASTNPWEEPSWDKILGWRRDQYRKNAYFLMVRLKDWGVEMNLGRLHGVSKWVREHSMVKEE